MVKANAQGKSFTFGSIASSFLSFLGGYQVCHNICLGIVAVLAVIGITVTGMPLLFLTKVAVPFWIVAVVLFAVTLAIYLKKKCLSKNIMILNAGFIVAGVPFESLQQYNYLFWIAGSVLILTAIILFIKKRRE
ncbi:MAG: hypothetical protein AABW87_02305 [Nanoarchaeota archaeon]